VEIPLGGCLAAANEFRSNSARFVSSAREIQTFIKQREGADMVYSPTHICQDLFGSAFVHWSPPLLAPLFFAQDLEDYYLAYAAF
jgi:hypothetical protein